MEPIVLEISSDEEEFPDYGWITDMLVKDDEDSDEVVIIKEVNNSKSKSRSSYSIRKDVDEDDDDDDCVVLDGDPDKPLELSDKADNVDSDDLIIVGEKGQIACRDFPHPRHDCVEFPFKSTSHAKHCNMCHCYVCDSLAPCMYWGTGSSADDHCNATNREEKWQICRKNLKMNNAAPTPVSSLIAASVSAVLPSSSHPMLQGKPQSTGHLRHQSITGQVLIHPSPNDQGNLVPHRIPRQPYRVHNVVQRYKGHMNVGAANHFVSSKPTFKRVGTIGSSLTNSPVISECMRSMVHHVAPNGQNSNKRPNNHHESLMDDTGMQSCMSRISSSAAVSCQPVTYGLPSNQLPNGQSMYCHESKNPDQHAASSGFPDVSLSWESIFRECDAYCAQPITGSLHNHMQFTELSHKPPPVQGFNSQFAGRNDPISQETLPAADSNAVDTGLPFFDFDVFWDGIVQS